MIKSPFIRDILDLLLDGDEWGLALRPQIDFLSEKECFYTGTGFYVYFNYIDGIPAVKDHQGIGNLDGVYIWSSAIEDFGEGLLSFKDGLVESLDVIAYGGDYPKEELTDYMMRQEFGISPQREIWCKDGKRYPSIL